MSARPDVTHVEPQNEPQRSAAEVFDDIVSLMNRDGYVPDWPADEAHYQREGWDRDGYDPAEFGGLPGWRSFTERAENLHRLRARKVLVLAAEHAAALVREAALAAAEEFRSHLVVIETSTGDRHFADPDAQPVHTARQALCTSTVYGRPVPESDHASGAAFGTGVTCGSCRWTADHGARPS